MPRLRGFLWLLSGLVVALIAAYVGFVTVSRAAEAPAKGADSGPKIQVVVAARPIPVRTLLTTDDVELKELPVSSVPPDAVTALDEAVGRVALVQLYPGEAVLSERLLEPNTVSADGRMALFVTEDEVLVAVPAQDYLSRSGMLKPGDKVDVHFSLDFPVERVPGEDAGSRGTGDALRCCRTCRWRPCLGPTAPWTPRPWRQARRIRAGESRDDPAHRAAAGCASA